MHRRLLIVCFALAVLRAPDQGYAQFNDPHNYDNTPVGTNQLKLAYAYARSNTSIDTSLIVTGANFNLNAGSISYTRYFGFVHRLLWAAATIPIAGLSGSVSGTNISGSTTGTADSSYQFGALLKGGTPLTVSQFADYKPTTILGMSITVMAPTGQYNPNKLLNLGSDRWSFKPEIAFSHPFGHDQKWQLDVYANAYFFTDNTSYRGAEILRQDPLPGLEGHISYSFLDNLWASFDTRYSFRGDTFVNNIDQNAAQENFGLGSEVNVSLNSRNALAFVFERALVHQNGPSATGFGVRYYYSWGKGYR